MPIDSRKVAIQLAQAHLNSTFSDYVVFGFDSKEAPFNLVEIGNVSSRAVLEKMKELLLAKNEPKS